MIRASLSRWHEAVVRPCIMGLMRRQFSAVRLLGEPPAVAGRPVLLLPNHSTWWDGFLVYLLKQKLLRRPLYLMMLEEQLRKNRVFSRIGAYSIDPGSLSGYRSTLDYTAELLSSPDRPVVCVFPQGELVPWTARPVHKRGIEVILRRAAAPVDVVLMAIRCEYLTSQHVQVFLQLRGAGVFGGDATSDVRQLQEKHHALLDELSGRITAGQRGVVLLRGRRSINEVVDTIRRRLRRG